MKTYSRLNKIQDETAGLPPEYTQSCRLCLSYISSASSSVDIFMPDKKLTLSKIKFCTGLEILEEDGLPSKLCVNCYNGISSFYCFKKMCISNEIKLQKYNRVPRSTDSELFLQSDEEEKKWSEYSHYKINKGVISLVQEQSNAVAFLLEEESIHPDAPDEVILQIKKDFVNSEEKLDKSITIPSEDKEVFNDKEKETGETSHIVHLKEPPTRDIHTRFYTCGECNKIFSRTDRLIAHEKEVHNINRLYCTHCSKSFVSKSLIERHMRTHNGNKPFHCSLCSKTFSQKESLNRHFTRLHCEKRYECDKCPKVFTSREGLKSHFFTHHTVRTNEELYRFKCKYCTKSFCHSSGLSRHLLTHTGVLFTCKICQKGFSDGSCLRRHKLMAHSAESQHYDVTDTDHQTLVTKNFKTGTLRVLSGKC